MLLVKSFPLPEKENELDVPIEKRPVSSNEVGVGFEPENFTTISSTAGALDTENKMPPSETSRFVLCSPAWLKKYN